MRRSNGRLDIYIDEALKAKCNLNIPEGVLAYVSLNGRAKKVTMEKGNGMLMRGEDIFIQIKSMHNRHILIEIQICFDL